MTTKHTPGPWHYAECQMGTPFVDTESAGDLFAAVLPLDEERANVRLMAAAPDLLAACEKLIAAFNRDGSVISVVTETDDFSDAYNAMEAAISKAKGQP